MATAATPTPNSGCDSNKPDLLRCNRVGDLRGSGPANTGLAWQLSLTSAPTNSPGVRLVGAGASIGTQPQATLVANVGSATAVSGSAFAAHGIVSVFEY